MKKYLTVLLVTASLVLTGCSAINSGRITAKHHEDDYYYTTMQCYSYNSKGICTVQMPVQHHVPDRYVFDLKQGEETGWVDVSSDEYDNYEVGDSYGKADTN